MNAHMAYPAVMARRQVLVQLDDALIESLDSLAAELGTNRSELLRRGARAVLSAAALRRADDRLVAAYRTEPQEPNLITAAARLARDTSPEW